MMQTTPRRYKLVVEYDGTDFVGWQLQAKGRSVQGALEQALKALFSIDIRIHGAGRTDSGVHASGQVAHFDLISELDGNAMKRAINAKLPFDVTVRSVEILDTDFHSRHTASSRSYVYTISHHRRSLERRTQWILHAALDHDAILDAVPSILGTHNFAAFSKAVPDLHHHHCHVFSAEWQPGEDLTRFEIRANRFLQGMVRCIVGGLVQVGRHRISPEQFKVLLESRDRDNAPMLAPAHGLVLTNVGYDQDDRAFIDQIIQRLRKEAGLPPSRVIRRK